MRYLILFVLLACRMFSATLYIDFVGGSDAAAGTKIAPWKHHPYMTGWTGSYSHAAGDQFIFKGGVSWDHTCWPMTIATGGSGTGVRDVYTVDQTWFTGGAWTRPIWDGEYTSLNSHNCYVSANYVQIDNIEMKRKKCSNVSTAPALLSCDGSGCLVTNCYLHGWQTTSASDDAYGGFVNGTSAPAVDLTMDNTEIENSENIGIQRSGVCIRLVAIIQNGCKIHDNSSAILFCLKFTHSQLYNISGDPFDGVYHCNGIYLYPKAYGLGVNGELSYSYLHDVYLGANMFYPNPSNNNTITMFNNVLYGHMSAQGAVEIQTDQFGTTAGTFSGYNNTINNFDVAAAAFHVSLGGSSPLLSVLNLYNNHVINAASLTDASVGVNTTTYNNGTNLSQTAATASGQGYVLGNLYAPTSISNGTYNTGTDESGTFTTDILGITRPQASIWDIGAYEFVGSGSTGGSTLSGKISLLGKISIK